MDFTFNRLKTVYKVEESSQGCEWFQKAKPGFNWFGECQEINCITKGAQFVLNRNFGLFQLDNELKNVACPVCSCKRVKIKNIGFKNTNWNIRAHFKATGPIAKLVKSSFSGKTYDDKIYIFDELDYQNDFEYLEIATKKLTNNAFAIQHQNQDVASNSSVSDSQNSDGEISINKDMLPNESGKQNPNDDHNKLINKNNGCMRDSSRSNLINNDQVEGGNYSKFKEAPSKKENLEAQSPIFQALIENSPGVEILVSQKANQNPPVFEKVFDVDQSERSSQHKSKSLVKKQR